MRRGNEFAVGMSILAAVVVVVAGALWLSRAHIGQREATYTARFRTVGGLGVGNPVTYRGVRVGSVQSISLRQDAWVEVDIKLFQGAQPPADPGVVAASASLFGEWTAAIVSLDQMGDDPALQAQLLQIKAQSGDEWPGVTLPDVGQLTAQANRIANDIASLTGQVRGVFDSTMIGNLRNTVQALQTSIDQVARFTTAQTGRLDKVSANVATTSNDAVAVAADLRKAMARLDSATGEGQLQRIANNADQTTADLRQVAADLRKVSTLAADRRESLVRVLSAADSLLTRIQSGSGTLGLLAADSTLYHETTAAVIQLRSLLADIQANPRKYFKFSVF